MVTLEIKFCDIPTYLRAGGFYRSLDKDDPEGIIEIPADSFHPDGERAADQKEFSLLLRVMVFWALDDIPVGVLKYCYDYHIAGWEDCFVDLPSAVLNEVQSLLLSVYSQKGTVPLATGRWDLITHAVQRRGKISSAAQVAAAHGNLRLLKYIHEEGVYWDESTCAAASQKGHLDCLRFAHEKGCPWDYRVYKQAATNGHLSCMEYAFEQGLKVWDKEVCENATGNGHLDCLQFAHEHGCPWDNKTTENAAHKGHVDCLQYALERGCSVDKVACSAASVSGHVECLQLLYQFGAPWDENAPFHAAMCRNVDCLQYLHENGCPWDEDTVTQAATSGHIAPLRYALQHDCPFNDHVVECVARSSNIECLQYVVEEQGLRMDKEVFKTALLRGNLICLQYLLDQGCPYLDAGFRDDAKQWELMEKIFRKDNPEFVLCVEYAVDRGWPVCENFINYIVTKDEACKQWLISEGHYTDPKLSLDILASFFMNDFLK